MISIYGKYSALGGIDEPYPVAWRIAPGYYWSHVMLSWRQRIVTWIPRYNFPLHNFPVHHVSINIILFSHRRSLPPRILWRHPLMMSSLFPPVIHHHFPPFFPWRLFPCLVMSLPLFADSPVPHSPLRARKVEFAYIYSILFDWLPRRKIIPIHTFPVHHVFINVILFSHLRSLPPRILWRHPFMMSSFSLTLVLNHYTHFDYSDSKFTAGAQSY